MGKTIKKNLLSSWSKKSDCCFVGTTRKCLQVKLISYMDSLFYFASPGHEMFRGDLSIAPVVV